MEAAYIPESRIMGVKSSPVSFGAAINIVNEWVRLGEKGRYVVLSNVFTIMNAFDNAYYKGVVEDSSLAVPDGKPIAIINRLKGYEPSVQLRGAELMQQYIRQSITRGVKHFFYGGKPGVAEQLKDHFQDKYPGVKIVGTYSPPFKELTAKEDAEICSMINSSGADILWVGLGSPKQDIWMYEHRGKLDVAVQLGVGAAFDFFTGQLKMAPKWMQTLCLEWLHRLFQEPRRLFPRYMYHNPRYLYYVMLDILNIKDFGRN